MGGMGSGRRRNPQQDKKDKKKAVKKIYCPLSVEEAEYLQRYAEQRGLFFGGLCRRIMQNFIDAAKKGDEMQIIQPFTE